MLTPIRKDTLMTQTVTFQGAPVTVQGTFPQIGDKVADFSLVAGDLSDATLASYEGKTKILNIFPSIDTDVCAMSVRQFNKLAGSLNNTVVLCISADLPFAQGRFCGAEGLDNVATLSTMRDCSFKQNYGVQIAEGPLKGLCTRAVVILDKDNKVIYSQLVPEITTEPDYDAAIQAAKA